MNRHGHKAVMSRVVKIVMAAPHMDQGKSGTLEGFDNFVTGYPG